MDGDPNSSLSHPKESESEHPTDVKVTVGDKASRGESVRKLLALLKQHQDALNKQEALSPHFTGDVLKVAEKCWEQIHSNIGEAIETKYQKIFEEFGALGKLSQLDELKHEHSSGQPAWRPSGIPKDDYDEAAGAETRLSVVPRFEQKYLEVQQQTQERQKIIEEKRQQIRDLESEIRTRLETLDSVPPTLKT